MKLLNTILLSSLMVFTSLSAWAEQNKEHISNEAIMTNADNVVVYPNNVASRKSGEVCSFCAQSQTSLNKEV